MTGTPKHPFTPKASSTTNRIAGPDGHVEYGIAASSAQAKHGPVRFYDSDRSLARMVIDFLQDGFEHGSSGIVIATDSQRGEIIRELTARSFDVVALQRASDLVLLDAEDALSRFMTNGRPDARKFRDVMCHAIEQASGARTGSTIRMFGQMVDVLWRKGERDAAIRLELLWNQLARTGAPSLLCGYAIGNFYKDARFEDICDQRAQFMSAGGQTTRVAAASADRGGRPFERRERR